jgi:hypothetical protein
MKKAISLLLLVCVSLPLMCKTAAIVEVAQTHYLLPAPNDLTIREFVRIKILDEDGYKHAIFQEYYNSFRKIKSLKYSIFDATNKRVKKFSKADAVDVMMNSSYEIGDVRILILDPDYRNYPFTVEMEIEIAYNGFLDFPMWMPRYTSDLEVQKAELTFDCYADFQYRTRELNGVAPASVAQKGELKSLSWSVANLPAVDRHMSYKSFSAAQPKVYLAPVSFNLEETAGSFQDWTTFGEWYRKLNENRNQISPETKQLLDGLKTKHGGNTPEIAKAVYKHLQSKTRYISIQLGIGGYQTIPSDEVERNGYGDCKALTNYMKAMLDYLKIPSNNVLVNAGSDVPDIQHDFPSNQFNHVFLAVPNATDTLWFECTSQTAPPAYIGTFTDDRYVLWVQKDGSRIVRTPARAAHESVKANQCVVNLQDQGDAELDLKVTQTGMFYDEAMYYENLPKDRIERFNYSKFMYKDFTIKSFNFSVPDKDNSLLTLDFKIKVNGLGRQLGTKMILPSNVLTPLEHSFFMDVLNKKTEVRRSFTIEDHVELTLPANYRVDVKPSTVEEKFQYGTFEMRFETDETGLLKIYRRAVIKKGLYEGDKFDAFSEMVKKIKAIEQNKIVLVSKT